MTGARLTKGGPLPLLAGCLLLAAGCTGKATDGGRTPSGGASGKGGAAGSAMGAGGNGAMGGAGAEPPRPSGPPPVRCDGSVVGGRALVRLTAAELTSSLRDLFPEAMAGGGINLGLSDPLASKDGFIDPGRLLVGEDSAEKLLTAARSLADGVVIPANLVAKFPCAGAAKDAACAGEVIKRYGRRLFRRPLTSEEQQRYLTLYSGVAAKADFVQGLKWALVALIQSPHALYRRQIGQAMGGGVYKLTQHELASELAYTFTGTTPSEDLLGKADRGQLGSKDALVTEARALVDSPAGRRHLGDFFRLWLGYDLVMANQRDKIPAFAGLRDKLAEETRSFIDRVVFTDKGGLGQLLTAPYTTVDAAMAAYYGLPAPAGPGFGMVTRPKGQGIGLLAQGSILAERSQSLNSSPTKRGILIRHKFLCLDVPPQPPVVPDLPPPGIGWKTTRERFEAAHAQGACAGCHRFFDPLGFPFEHFDEGGRFRQTEGGNPIDPSGFAIDGMGQMLFAVKGGQEELATVLAGRPEVAACTAETLVKYLFAQDRDCLAGTARNEFVEGKIGFSELAARIAGEPHFSERRD